MTYARQHESLRTNSASLIAVATGGVLALFASAAIPPEERSWLAIFLAMFVAAINLLGWFIGKKHYERTRRHQAIATAYRKVISDNCKLGSYVLTDVRDAADLRHKTKKKFKYWENCVSLHELWGTIHVVFVLLGLYMVAYLWCSR
jgi:Fe2+ transport system protein B